MQSDEQSHTHKHTEVRQGIQTQTPVSSLGSNHEAKVYSLTSVALQTSTYTFTHEPTDQARQQREGDEEGWRGVKEGYDGGGFKE